MIKPLQQSLQWMFLRLEAVFNTAFGDKLNPLYHLGAITFFLFWIVTASGLYIYIFYKTSVSETFISVQSLSHDQWYAGGIMRSAHRYASDGMVLTMLLHMIRYFAFDRLRGYRWFSWLTGVILIWLVFVSGINGYMLPWDKLAQFVVVASAELLDWLPIFGGALMRNFIYQGNVNDRLFTLLSFIHIGVPLFVLMLMWIHVQRIPGASTNPPKPIMLSLSVALLALSLVKPAVSQGGAAQLAMAPQSLEFDWFYLLVFALLYIWPTVWVWALLAGQTVVLALLPWLPPKFRRGTRREFEITVHPDRQTITTRADETILEAGLRAGIALPYECRNGGCGKCKCTVLYGSVEPGIFQTPALSADERALGKVLMCCATPLADLEIEYEPVGALAPAPARIYTGRVAKMERLAEDVMRVKLVVPTGEKIAFRAGQYINILLEDGSRRAFSFANPPHENAFIDLHIRRIPDGRYTAGHVFTRMKEGDEIRFEGPLGSFVLHESDRPIIFVAGATGFAPVKSMIEDAFHHGVQRRMLLYWGVRKRRDLYLAELAEQWQREHNNFVFIPVLSEAEPEDHWQGRTGVVHEAILQDFPDLTGYELYVCGSVRMVETAYPALLAQGMAEAFCFSDAFTPAARPAAAAQG